MINDKFGLVDAFQEILYRIEIRIKEGSGWIIESIKPQYINISTYRPLLVGSYVSLPAELHNSKKELINTKNSHKKCFMVSY